MPFLKNYGKCEKTQGHQTCHNRKNKKLFGVRIKLSCNKIFHKKIIRNRNKKTDTYE